MDAFARIYETERETIEKLLRNAVLRKRPQSLYGPCEYILTSSGKRLRPFLVLVSALAAGGRPSDVYNAAAAFEMIHTFSLVHDDVMDRSKKRRGQDTVHEKYGLNSSILAGDLLFGLSYKYLIADCSSRNTREILKVFTASGIKVAEGQAMDLEFVSRKEISSREYKEMIYKKTAVITETCCLIGAWLCGASSREKNAFVRYGRYLGMAFQIQDDLFDSVGDEKTTGKTTSNDIIERKKNYLFVRAFKKATKKEKIFLQKIMKTKKISSREIFLCKKLYEKLGVFDDAKNEVKKYIRMALRSTDALSDNDGTRMMRALAETILTRKS